MSLQKPELEFETEEANWSGLYRAAGAGALIAVAFMLLDFGLSFAGGDVETGTLSAVEWFAFFQKDWFMGLRNLGLFNVINTTLTIPLYLALYRLHRKSFPALTVLALVLVLLGAAVYDANNRALALLTLSSQYAAAASEAQKSLLAAAGTVILAQAEDFTPGTFLGFFFSSAGSLLMMAAMLRGKVFRKWLSLAGLTGTGLLLIFTISVTFVPATFSAMMLLAMLGGLMMLVWNIRVALSMFGMGKPASNPAAGAPRTGTLTAAAGRTRP